MPLQNQCDISLKVQDRWGGEGVEVEGNLKQSVNYQWKDFFSFINNL